MGGTTMNWDQIAGKWMQFKGKAREQWAKLTDSDIDAIGGRKEVLLGKLRERYGYAKEAAEKEIALWADKLEELKDDIKKKIKPAKGRGTHAPR
jgi:uncharacterized protein YjbJ (UPF0337 family)